MSKDKGERTAAQRMKNREARIKASGLSHLKVIMHKGDADEVRKYAKKLYEKRGFDLSKES